MSRNCFGCRYADVAKEAIYWNHCNYANVAYNMVVYCKLQKHNVRFPTMYCVERKPVEPLRVEPLNGGKET